MIAFCVLMSIGQVILASGVIQGHGQLFWLVSASIGAGYGAAFSLTPIIVSVIWGVENFGTNWGICAMVPAFGATVWGLIYSAVYQWAAKLDNIQLADAGKELKRRKRLRRPGCGGRDAAARLGRDKDVTSQPLRPAAADD